MKRIIFIILLMAASAMAGGWGSSIDGVYQAIAYNHYIAADSGEIFFGYPDLTNLYDTAVLVPDTFDSLSMIEDSLFLDSIGNHRAIVRIRFGANTLIDTVTWTHYVQKPTLEAPAGSPLANVCVVFGDLIDLGGDWVQHAIVTATLDAENVRDTCSNTLVMAKPVWSPTSTSSGRFEIPLVYSSCVQGKKYTLTVEKHGFAPQSVRITVPNLDTLRVVW